ncbi:MAG: permease-like cell division protein FtsX [Eubacteriales bacterium]|nr:permease-like cell division protein FtsX [Eubacteriales bacterium]
MKFSGFGYLLKEGIKSIWTNRMMSIASVGVLISCLLLTGAASLLSLNVSNAVDKVGGTNVTRVFLDLDILDEEAKFVEQDIAHLPNVEKTEFISKDEAIKDYQDTLREDIFNQLIGEGNPLPHAVDVTMTDLARYDETIGLILGVDGVDSVRDTKDIAEKLTSLQSLVNTLSFWIVLALVIVSVFIISNTIRMTMYARRFEISIMKSVGATDTFVRIPFVIEGMTIGLISGVVTSVLLVFLYDIIMKTVQNIAQFNFVPYSQVGIWASLIFILAGMLIGALGSMISISRYLRKEGNELLGW